MKKRWILVGIFLVALALIIVGIFLLSKPKSKEKKKPNEMIGLWRLQEHHCFDDFNLTYRNKDYSDVYVEILDDDQLIIHQLAEGKLLFQHKRFYQLKQGELLLSEKKDMTTRDYVLFGGWTIQSLSFELKENQLIITEQLKEGESNTMVYEKVEKKEIASLKKDYQRRREELQRKQREGVITNSLN